MTGERVNTVGIDNVIGTGSGFEGKSAAIETDRLTAKLLDTVSRLHALATEEGRQS